MPFRSPVLNGVVAMKKIAAWTFALVAVPAMASGAEAKGCIKGAIVGGIAGKMAGHGKVGAAGGCAIGHHRAAKKANAGNAQPQ
jgi:hypothetical protein